MLQQLQQAGVTPQDVLILGGVVVLALVLVILAFATGANQSKQRLKRVTQMAQKAEVAGAILDMLLSDRSSPKVKVPR